MGSVLEAPDNYSHLSDQELARLFLEHPNNPEISESLAQRCRRKLVAIIRYSVFTTGMYPSTSDPETFAADMISEVETKFASDISTLCKPEALSAWLRQIAMNTILSAIRKIKGRLKDGHWEHVPLTSKTLDNEEVNILDSKCARDAATRYSALSRITDPEREAITQDIIERVIRKHGLSGSKRDLDSVVYFLLMCRKQATFEQIALMRKTTIDDAYHLIGHDEREMAEIARRDFGVTSNDL